jgi:environmental stress-induced protein Ves
LRLTFLPAAQRVAQPWKNGGGVTREVAVSPGGGGFDFDWRVSIAEVGAGGPFSRFPEVDRILTVLDGAMRLSIPGREPALLDADAGPYPFPGDVDCEAELIAPVIDLNVMTRRGGPRARVTPARGEVIVVKAPTVLIVATAPSTVDDQVALAPYDALRIDDGLGRSLVFSGEAWVVGIGG